MCSFLFSTIKPKNDNYNKNLRLRGPDSTKSLSLGRYHLTHNLLSFRQPISEQPYLSSDETIAIMFNGEIYNCPKNYASEAEFIHDLFLQHGFGYARYLDGEYAILVLDLRNNVVCASTDCFGTKPLFFGYKGNDFGFSSYRSALNSVGFSETKQISANTTIVYNLNNEGLNVFNVHTFDISQHSGNIEDWFSAFDNAVKKRIKHRRGIPFVGLSSGYDSGAITASLLSQDIPFCAISVNGQESQSILEERSYILAKRKISHSTIDANLIDRSHWKNWLHNNVENEEYFITDGEGQRLEVGKRIHDDPAALMLCSVCDLARQQDAYIYLSGSGADEVYGDYGHNGVKFARHSNFGGRFPDNLLGTFPWPSFFGSTQHAYLLKEEMVAGSFGLEARYPFLDTTAVQAFLNLSPKIKNSAYKAVIDAYLQNEKFPFEKNKKIGFSYPKQSRSVFKKILNMRK